MASSRMFHRLFRRSFSVDATSSNASPSAMPSSLSSGQRVFLTLGASLLAFLNTERGDLVAALGEATVSDRHLRRLRDRMAETEEGRYLLEHKLQVDSESVSMGTLKNLPENTFGRRYFEFMNGYGYTPEGRSPVKFIDDPELAYVMQRYRETHDYIHVLVGLPTSVVGEISQKWFELCQSGLPMCALSALVGPARLPFSQQHLLLTKMIPWAVRCHMQSKFLLGVHFERRFEEDIDVVRHELGIREAPPCP